MYVGMNRVKSYWKRIYSTCHISATSETQAILASTLDQRRQHRMKIWQIIICFLSMNLSTFLSPICVHILVSELLDSEFTSWDKSSTNNLFLMPTLAPAALYKQAALYIHGKGGTVFTIKTCGIGMHHFVCMPDLIWSMHQVIQAAFSASSQSYQTQCFARVEGWWCSPMVSDLLFILVSRSSIWSFIGLKIVWVVWIQLSLPGCQLMCINASTVYVDIGVFTSHMHIYNWCVKTSAIHFIMRWLLFEGLLTGEYYWNVHLCSWVCAKSESPRNRWRTYHID